MSIVISQSNIKEKMDEDDKT